MKEKALSEALLAQSNKVLDAKEGKITVDEACSDFTHCNEADVMDFKNRMVGKTKESPKVETKEEKPKKQSGLRKSSLKG